MRDRVVELEGQVGALTEKVAELARLAFGKSSEKKPARQTAEQTAGEGGPDGAGAGQQVGDLPAGRGRGQRKGSRGHGRRDYSHLPTREEIHDVPDGERVCPRCGADYVPFGEECCELIDWQVQLVRIVIRRPTYRRGCRCPVRGVLAAPPTPKPIGKGRFTSTFLARLLVEKFVHGRPTHRIAAALAHDGLDLADGTLAGVLAACSDLLAPRRCQMVCVKPEPRLRSNTDSWVLSRGTRWVSRTCRSRVRPGRRSTTCSMRGCSTS